MIYKRLYSIIALFLIFIIGVQAQNTLVKTSEEDLYRKGIELLDKQKFGAAREFFSQYIQIQPTPIKSIDAEYYIAYCALNLFHADGEDLVNNFIQKYPYHPKTALAFYDLGSLYYDNKKYDKAIEYFEKINFDNLSENQKVDATFKLGYSYFTKKEFERAIISFNKVKVTNNKYTYAASYYAGYSEVKSGAYAEALTDLTRAESNEDYKSLVPHMITGIYYRQGKYDEVITYGEAALAKTETQVKSEISLMVADSWYFKRDYKKAVENFNRYLTEEKGNATRELTYRIGYAQYKTNLFVEATESFKSIAAKSDTLGQSSAFYLGLTYLKLGNKEFALMAFDQARRLNFNTKTKEEALFYFGKVNVDLDRHHDAIAPLKEFVQAYPQNNHAGEAGELLSEAFLKTKNYAEAIAYIDGLKIRSIRLNQAYQKLTYYKATEFFNEGKYEAANEMFTKSMGHNFDRDLYAASLYWKGEIYSINKNYNEAINTYGQVFERTGDDDNLYHLKARYSIGYAYYNTQQYDKAMTHFRAYTKKLEKESDKLFYTDALVRIADLYYVDKKYDDALRYYDLAIENYTSDVDYAFYQKGIVLVYQDKLVEATSNFKTVINKFPQSVYLEDAIYQKAQLDFRNNNLEEAIDGFSKLIGTKLNNQPYESVSLLKRAVIYNNLKRHEEAMADYNTLLDKYYNDPIHEDAIRGAQQTYALLDKSEEFNQKLEEFGAKNPQSSVLEDVSYESAKSHYFEAKYKKAIPLFENFLSKYSASPNAADAKYYLADSYYQLGDMEHSTPIYIEVVKEKSSAYVTKALQKLADMNFKSKNYGAAKEYYNLFSLNSKNKKEKNNALMGLMETHFMLASYDSVEYFANEVLKNGNLNINAESKANMYIGRAAYMKGNDDKAIDYFLNLINTNNELMSAEAQYYIAEIQFKQKKYKQSIESLYYLNNNFSSNEYWLGKSFLLIAENLIAMNELFQAKSALTSIITNSKDQEIVEKAKNRLIELEASGKEEEVK